MAAPPVKDTLKEYGRGIAGGLLFSFPLLYTVEIWNIGVVIDPLRLLIYVGIIFVLLVGYNHYAGIRESSSPVDAMIDSAEEMGIGLVVAALVLWLIGQFPPGIGLHEAVGKLLTEGMVVAIGVSIGTAELGRTEDDGEDDEPRETRSGADGRDGGSDGEDDGRGAEAHSFRGQVVIGLCGAVLVTSNVAPTQEIVIIATTMVPSKMLALAVLSMLTGTGILYYANFRQSKRLSSKPLQVAVGSFVMYALALVTAAFFLWFFERFQDATLSTVMFETVVLSAPAALGSSAGRLLLEV